MEISAVLPMTSLQSTLTLTLSPRGRGDKRRRLSHRGMGDKRRRLSIRGRGVLMKRCRKMETLKELAVENFKL